MPHVKLANDVTIADLTSGMDDPIGYVRGVLENMAACKKLHRSAIVSVGIMGKGKTPHYRVSPDSFFEDMMKDRPLSAHFVAYDGRNHHQKSDWGENELKVEHWSSKSMNYDEVRALLGSLRGPLKARAK